MSYLIGKKLCMLHIPKTGGTWVKRTLKAKRIRPAHIPEPPGPADLGDRLIFTIVREPAPWLISLWGHLVNSDHGIKRFRLKGTPFEELCFTCYDVNIPCQRFLENYNNFMPDGTIPRLFHMYTRNANFICHTESLREDLISVLKISGELTEGLEQRVKTWAPQNEMPEPLQSKCFVDPELVAEINQKNAWNWLDDEEES